MKKSILYIFVVLMALSLTLSAVSAEDVAADAADVADEAVVEEAPADEGAAGGDEELVLTQPAVVTGESISAADVAVDVKALEETPFEIVWGIAATNNGPEVAPDTVVRFTGTDNMFLYDYIASVGEVYPADGVWYIGDLNPGDVAVLLLDTIKIDYGPYDVDALITAEIFDPVLSNNYDCEVVGGEPADASAAEETMPAAGNPIAMALLALVTIAGTAFTRRL